MTSMSNTGKTVKDIPRKTRRKHATGEEIRRTGRVFAVMSASDRFQHPTGSINAAVADRFNLLPGGGLRLVLPVYGPECTSTGQLDTSAFIRRMQPRLVQCGSQGKKNTPTSTTNTAPL